MIVYSVTVNIEDEAEKEWLEWMKQSHIPDVMNTGKFMGYRMLRVLSKQEDEAGQTYNIQYECASMQELDEYMNNHAPELQKEHSEKFSGKFVAFRTLLEKA